jgi:hypothetical protein
MTTRRSPCARYTSGLTDRSSRGALNPLEVSTPSLHDRSYKVTLHLTDEELRRWEHVRRSLSDGELAPSHSDALMMVLGLVEEASTGRLGRLTEHWRARERELVEE